MIIKFIKQLLSSYVEIEKQLTQIRCLVVDNGQKIRKVIKKFPRKHRNEAMRLAYNKAYWGSNTDEIVTILESFRIRIKR